jgi:hypothetical protein
MEKAKTILYIDAFGREHEALVVDAKRRSSYRDRNGIEHTLFTPVADGSDDCIVSGLYINPALEPDSIVRFYDVPHFTDESKQESNPALPSYHVNCWKEFSEQHSALPADHPAFDHPFHVEYVTDADGNPLVDQFGQKVRKQPARPEYDAHVADHQAKPETQEAMAAAAAAPESAEEFKPDAAKFLVTRGYTADEAAQVVSVLPGWQLQEMADAQRAMAIYAGPVDQADGATSESANETAVISNLRESNKQLSIAAEQGSDALLAKDAQIDKLRAENARLQQPAAAPATGSGFLKRIGDAISGSASSEERPEESNQIGADQDAKHEPDQHSQS